MSWQWHDWCLLTGSYTVVAMVLAVTTVSTVVDWWDSVTAVAWRLQYWFWHCRRYSAGCDSDKHSSRQTDETVSSSMVRTQVTVLVWHSSCYSTGCDSHEHSSRQTVESVSQQWHGAYSTRFDTVIAAVLAVTVMSIVADRLMRQCHRSDMVLTVLALTL